jgi:hypothetical protein
VRLIVDKLKRYAISLCNNSYFVILFLVILTTVLLAFSWKQWPDPIIDFGRELYIPWQITQGKSLYQDIAHHKGPLSQYLNAFVFWIFNPSLMALAMANAVWTVVIAFLFYSIFRIASSAIVGVFAAGLFLLVFGFSQILFIANNNFICPYSHEATHGLLLALATMLAFYSALKYKQNGRFFLTGILFGLLFLTKIEVFLPAAVALAVGWAIYWIRSTNIKPTTIKSALFFLSAFGSVLVITVLLMATKMPFSVVWNGIYAPWKYSFNPAVSNTLFYKNLRGTDNLVGNLLEILKQSSIVLVFSSALIAADIYLSKHKKICFFLVLSIVAIIFYLIFSGTLELYYELKWLVLVPFVFSIFVGRIIFTELESKKIETKIFLLCFSVFSQLMLLKILLSVTTFQYGIFLASPCLLLLAGITLYWVPQYLQQKNISCFVFRSVWVALFALLIYSHLFISSFIFDGKPYLIGEGADSFYSDKTAPYINEALKYLQSNMAPNETVLVLPEGGMINYLLRRQSGSQYLLFVPTEFDIFGEENILNDIKSGSPDYVVLIHRDTSEFGLTFFGKDYAVKIFDYLKRNYARAVLIGDRPFQDVDEFGIEIIKKISKGPP